MKDRYSPIANLLHHLPEPEFITTNRGCGGVQVATRTKKCYHAGAFGAHGYSIESFHRQI